jgi:hypothetical protein
MLLALYAALTVSVPVAPDISTSVRFAGNRHALVSVFPGPFAEGDTSQGLEAAPWAVWQGVDKKIRLAKLGSQSNSSPEVFGLENWVNPLDRISLAFDQNGRRVVALSQAGTVSLSRVLPGPTENRVNWTGVDCLLWFDGLLRDVAGGEPTDVIAFYLAVTRDSIKFRIQSENYSIERTYATLTQPASLDALAMSQNRLVLYPTAQDGTTVNVISEPYGIKLRVDDSVQIGTALFSGADVSVVRFVDTNSDAAISSAAFVSGVDFSPLTSSDDQAETAFSGAAFVGGVDFSVITSSDAQADTAFSSAAFIGGLDVKTVFTGDPESDAVQVGAAFVSGVIV